MLGLKTWVAQLLLGTGKIPCDLPKIEMDADAGDRLFLEVRNRKGEVLLRVEADVQRALEISRERLEKKAKRIMDKARKEKAR